jgi:hypothetical protein
MKLSWLHGSRRILLAVALAAGGCGGDADAPGGAGFTATIDGKAWAAAPISIGSLASPVPGGIILLGSQNANGVSTSITITLNDITGPGTYALGVGPGVYGGTASVGEGTGGANANVWETPLDGVSGTITLTSLGAGRIAGTFAFKAEAGRKNTAGGTRTVTDGRFDLAFMGNLQPVPDNMGAKVSATLNGLPYNAWYIDGRLKDYTGGAGINISTTTSDNALSLQLVGVTAPGTYPVSDAAPLRTIIVGHNGGTAATCCWGLNAGGDTGTITVTSLTATRVKGTFSATLQPQPGRPATSALIVTDGTFDVGVQ